MAAISFYDRIHPLSMLRFTLERSLLTSSHLTMILPFLLFLLLVTQAYTEEDHATLETNKSEVVYFHLHINLLFNSVILNPFKSSKRIGNWKYNGGWGSSCFRIALGPGLFSTNGVVLRGIARYMYICSFLSCQKISCFGEKNVRINSFLQF